MSGVRLHHPTLRSCTYILWEPEHRDPRAQGGIRKAKKRPLLIDANGDTLVSLEIWHRLQAAGAVGRIEEEFIFLNEIPDPPTLRIGNSGPATPTVERQVNDAIRQIAPAVSSYSIVPSTKYRAPLRLVRP